MTRHHDQLVDQLAAIFDIDATSRHPQICRVSFPPQMGTWNGCYWLFFIPAIPHGRFTDFASIFRVFAMLLFFIPVMILAKWGGVSYFDLPSQAIEVINLQDLRSVPLQSGSDPRYAITLACGSRYEPWITGVEAFNDKAQ